MAGAPPRSVYHQWAQSNEFLLRAVAGTSFLTKRGLAAPQTRILSLPKKTRPQPLSASFISRRTSTTSGGKDQDEVGEPGDS
jgi:hypothetical protein